MQSVEKKLNVRETTMQITLGNTLRAVALENMRSHVGVWRYRHELYRECAIGQKGIFIARRYGTTLSLQSSKRSGEEVGFTVGLYFIFSCQGVSHVPSNISTVKLGRNVPAI